MFLIVSSRKAKHLVDGEAIWPIKGHARACQIITCLLAPLMKSEHCCSPAILLLQINVCSGFHKQLQCAHLEHIKSHKLDLQPTHMIPSCGEVQSGALVYVHII